MCGQIPWNWPRPKQSQSIQLCGTAAAAAAAAARPAARGSRGLSHISAECRSERILWRGTEVREGIGCLPAQRSLHIGQDAGGAGATGGATAVGGQARPFRLQVAALLQVQSWESRFTHTGGTGGATACAMDAVGRRCRRGGFLLQHAHHILPQAPATLACTPCAGVQATTRHSGATTTGYLAPTETGCAAAATCCSSVSIRTASWFLRPLVLVSLALPTTPTQSPPGCRAQDLLRALEQAAEHPVARLRCAA